MPVLLLMHPYLNRGISRIIFVTENLAKPVFIQDTAIHETPTITPSVPEGESWKFYYYAGSARIAMRLKNLYGEQVYYFFNDYLGSTNVMTDPNGNVMSETLYKAWGEIRYSSGSSPTDFTYTPAQTMRGQAGQRSEVDDIGLMFYNARWYSPELGRFTQPDTIAFAAPLERSERGLPGAGNPAAYDRYAYVINNPIKLNDPSGHCYNYSTPEAAARCNKYWESLTNHSYHEKIESELLINVNEDINENEDLEKIYHTGITLRKYEDMGFSNINLSTIEPFHLYPETTQESSPTHAALLLGVNISTTSINGETWSTGAEFLLLDNYLAGYTNTGHGSSIGIPMPGGNIAIYGGVILNIDDPFEYVGSSWSSGITLAIKETGITAGIIPKQNSDPYGIYAGYAPGANISSWSSYSTTLPPFINFNLRQ